MSIWSAIAYKIKEIMSKMIGARTIQQTLHVTPAISSQMETAIKLWSDMYKNKGYWIKEPSYEDPVRVVSLGLPAMIASEKARVALLEWGSEITTPTKKVEIENSDEDIIPTFNSQVILEERPIGPTDRAEFLNDQYKKLKSALRKNLEYAIAKGGMVIKPYIVQRDDHKMSIEFDFIQADYFYPLAFNASGEITEAAFMQPKVEKDIIYRRVEYHKYSNGTVQVINKAYRSTNSQIDTVDLGQEIPLSDVAEWKDLQSSVTIQNVDRCLFAYFKMPEANIIDMDSPLGISGYARAVDLIKDADMQYSRMLWEYEAGEMAIDVDRDALNFIAGGTDRSGNHINGHSALNRLQQRLFRKIDLGVEGNTYQQYAPTLRDTSYIQGLNTILMRIEDACGISRGILSDGSAEARTATELRILKQRSYQSNNEIQISLENTLRDVVYIMNVYCDLYKITPAGEYDISFEWDDSILVDVNEELTKRLTLMQNGIVSKVEVRMWYFGETERQARQALAKVDEESQQEMERDLAAQASEYAMKGDIV